MSIVDDLLYEEECADIDMTSDIEPLDDDNVWREFYLEIIDDSEIIDDIFIELKNKHNLSWKELYINRKSGFIYDFDDIGNLYISWLTFVNVTSLTEWRNCLSCILARISYFDQDLFRRLFLCYLSKGAGLSNLTKFTHILQHSLCVYADKGEHKRFIGLLEFIVDEYMYTLNKEDVSDVASDATAPIRRASEDIVGFICALVYGNNYCPALIDKLLEIIDIASDATTSFQCNLERNVRGVSGSFRPKLYVWHGIILKILRVINVKMQYITSPSLCINYILFGIPNSFESKMGIIKAYSKSEAKEIFSIINNASIGSKHFL